jgi:hypothetical protein
MLFKIADAADERYIIEHDEPFQEVSMRELHFRRMIMLLCH